MLHTQDMWLLPNQHDSTPTQERLRIMTMNAPRVDNYLITLDGRGTFKRQIATLIPPSCRDNRDWQHDMAEQIGNPATIILTEFEGTVKEKHGLPGSRISIIRS